MNIGTLVLGSAVLATCALGTTLAQTIEITSSSIGTVKVRPEPIAPRTGVQHNAPGANGVDFGIRRNRDGILYDRLDPRQDPAAGRAREMDETARAGIPNGPTAIGQPNAPGRIAGSGPSPSDFPYGINGAR